MNVEVWKIVAQNWRTVDDTVEKLSIVQKVTKNAIDEIKQKGAHMSVKDFLSTPAGMDEDDDLP